MVDPSSCTLYETWDTHYHANGKSKAGSGAIWSLDSMRCGRPDGPRPTPPDCLFCLDWSTTTKWPRAPWTTPSGSPPVYPAGLPVAGPPPGGAGRPALPADGARFRLSPSFSLPASACSAMCQTVITTMQTYGLIVADNGSNWFFQGVADSRWTATEVDQLKQIPASPSWPSTSPA